MLRATFSNFVTTFSSACLRRVASPTHQVGRLASLSWRLCSKYPSRRLAPLVTSLVSQNSLSVSCAAREFQCARGIAEINSSSGRVKRQSSLSANKTFPRKLGAVNLSATRRKYRRHKGLSADREGAFLPLIVSTTSWVSRRRLDGFNVFVSYLKLA